MQTNLAVAERRTEEARRVQAECLDLGDLALGELPAALADLPYLRTLPPAARAPAGASTTP